MSQLDPCYMFVIWKTTWCFLSEVTSGEAEFSSWNWEDSGSILWWRRQGRTASHSYKKQWCTLKKKKCTDLQRRHLITEHCCLTFGSLCTIKWDQKKLAAYTANFILQNYLFQVHVTPCQYFLFVLRVIWPAQAVCLLISKQAPSAAFLQVIHMSTLQLSSPSHLDRCTRCRSCINAPRGATAPAVWNTTQANRLITRISGLSKESKSFNRAGNS